MLNTFAQGATKFKIDEFSIYFEWELHGEIPGFRVRSNRFLRRMMQKVVNSVSQEASLLMEEEEPACCSPLDGNDDRIQMWKQRLELEDRSNCQFAPPAGLSLWRVNT